MAERVPKSGTNWREQAQRLREEALLFYFVFKHPRTHWYVRCIAACTVAYLFSPVQLIPSFIPVIGFLDDFLVLFVGANLVRKFTPPDVLSECHKLAEAAEVRRNEKEQVKNRIARFAVLLTTVSWLVAFLASALVAAYIHR
jgi:uncharacterized membrane protein YkvA (DUF1232 family)